MKESNTQDSNYFLCVAANGMLKLEVWKRTKRSAILLFSSKCILYEFDDERRRTFDVNFFSHFNFDLFDVP